MTSKSIWDTYLRLGMKPKLLINAGINHCATTPFFYTLSVDQQYCHPGHKKEMNYLLMSEIGPYQRYVDKISWLHARPNAKEFNNNVKGTWEGYVSRPGYGKIDGLRRLREGYNSDDHLKPPMLKQWRWDTSEMSDFFDPPFTIEKYIKYYLHHWEHIKNDYQSCGDFANSNAALSEDFLRELKVRLEEHFEVKCCIILRDPIRRMYSLSKNNTRFQQHLKKNDFTVDFKDIEPIKYQVHCFADYVGIVKRWKAVWGDQFFTVIMEEFWEDSTPFAEFLGFPLPKIHENVFYPEKQFDFDKMQYLQDQWSVQEPMTDYSLGLARRKMIHIYHKFEEYFGYRPSSWQSW